MVVNQLEQIMDVSILLGKTLKSVSVIGHDEALLFVTDDGDSYTMYHEQGCCESVYLESIVGDLEDLIGSSLLVAEQVSNVEESSLSKQELCDEYYEWTFYKFATRKGYVDLRWFGTSNGYYSVSVDFKKV